MSLSLLLQQAVLLRKRAFDAYLMACINQTTEEWTEYYRLDALANVAYRRLGPADAQEFIRQIRLIAKAA